MVAIFELIFGFIFGLFLVFGREISKMRSKMTKKFTTVNDAITDNGQTSNIVCKEILTRLQL